MISFHAGFERDHSRPHTRPHASRSTSTCPPTEWRQIIRTNEWLMATATRPARPRHILAYGPSPGRTSQRGRSLYQVTPSFAGHAPLLFWSLQGLRLPFPSPVFPFPSPEPMGSHRRRETHPPLGSATTAGWMPIPLLLLLLLPSSSSLHVPSALCHQKFPLSGRNSH